jgi:hypothetical protein
METTTIKIRENTKTELDKFRECESESYDDVIKKMISIIKTCKNNPLLSKEAVLAIENARKRIKEGLFVTEAEAKKRLGF